MTRDSESCAVRKLQAVGVACLLESSRGFSWVFGGLHQSVLYLLEYQMTLGFRVYPKTPK